MQLFIYNNAASGNMKCSLLIRAINAIIRLRLFLSMMWPLAMGEILRIIEKG